MAENFATRTTVSASITGTRTNLALRSQEFDNAAWTKALCSITPNSTVAPDGTLTADTIVEDGTAGFHSVLQAVAVTGVVNTASVYLKAANRQYCAVQIGGNSSYFGLFGPGSIVLASGFYGTIAPVGNGWYYCTLSAIPSSTNFIFLPANNAPTSNYLGLNQDSVYIWGAQIETGPFASAYKATTTATVSGVGSRSRLLTWSAVGGAAASSMQLRDGDSSGAILANIDIPAGVSSSAQNSLAENPGVLFPSGIYVGVTGTPTGITIFYTR